MPRQPNYDPNEEGITEFNRLVRRILARRMPELGMSQEDLSERIGRSRSTIGAMCRLPGGGCSHEILISFCDELKVDSNERLLLEELWLQGRIGATKQTGPAAMVYVECALRGKSPKERREIFEEAMRQYRRNVRARRAST